MSMIIPNGYWAVYIVEGDFDPFVAFRKKYGEPVLCSMGSAIKLAVPAGVKLVELSNVHNKEVWITNANQDGE